MDSIDEIRKKKLEALQQQQAQSGGSEAEQQQLQSKLAQLEMMVKQVFTKEALERYGNIKAAYPEKAMQLLVVLSQAIQSGQVKQIDDELFKQILKKLQPEKKDIKIKRV